MTGAPPLTTTATATDPRAVALARLYDLLVVVAAAAAIIVAIWLASEILVVVFASALLATILHGASALLARVTRLPYWASLTIVVLLIAGLLAGLAVIAGPGLIEQGTQLQQALRGQVSVLHERLSAHEWGRTVLDQVPSQLGGNKTDATIGVPTGLAGSVFGVVGSAVGLFGTVAVVLIAALYLAASPATYVNGALRLVPNRHRAKARELFEVSGKALWAWSAGQALDMLVVGVLSGTGLWLIGVPLPLVLGVLAGLLNFVPYIGAITGAIPAVIIAFSLGATAGLETIALYAVIQGFEGNVMAPMIQKRAVDLPPGLTILSQTAFGVILGIPGLIFATPLTAALLAVMGKATKPLTDDQSIPDDTV